MLGLHVSRPSFWSTQQQFCENVCRMRGYYLCSQPLCVIAIILSI